MSEAPRRDHESDPIEDMLENAAMLEAEAHRDAQHAPETGRERELVDSFRSQLEARFGGVAGRSAAAGPNAPATPAATSQTRGRVLQLGFRIALAAAVMLSATIGLSRFFDGDQTAQVSIHLSGDAMLSILAPAVMDQVPEAFECASKLGDGATYRFDFLESQGNDRRVLLSRTTTEPRVVLTNAERTTLGRSFVLEVTAENELLGTGTHRASRSFSWR